MSPGPRCMSESIGGGTPGGGNPPPTGTPGGGPPWNCGCIPWAGGPPKPLPAAGGKPPPGGPPWGEGKGALGGPPGPIENGSGRLFCLAHSSPLALEDTVIHQ
eukprot:1389313-Amorphochlora_amoeboformis.AAC.1